MLTENMLYNFVADNIIAIIGAVTGSVSLFILTYKQLWKERPRLIYNVEKTYWYPPETNLNSKWYTISISLLFKNTGERSTTIHNVSLSFEYMNKQHTTDNLQYPQEISLLGGDSKSQTFNFSINQKEIQITDNPKNVKLTIEYTHGKKTEIIYEIQKLSR